MRIVDLYESRAIGLSKKAYNSLSHEAKYAIDAWESAMWHTGRLVQSYKANDEIIQEINRAFEPVRAALPEKVKLYRGLQHDPEGINDHIGWKEVPLQSWTEDRRVAEYFAGMRSDQAGENRWNHPVLSDDQIENIVRKYELTGAAKAFGHTFIRNKEYPQYYDIYRGREYITDGDNLRQHLEDENQYRKDLMDKRANAGQVIERDIPRDDIIWITNNLNSKEYIVKSQPIGKLDK